METKEILIFSIDDKQYGVSVGELQAIENYNEPREVDNAPEFSSGVVDIRQDVYPVIDMRKVFHMPSIPVTEDTKYLILNTEAGQVACTVDKVIEIFTGRGDEIQPFPTMLRTQGTEYADCIMKVKDKLVVVVSAKNVFTKEQVSQIAAMTENEE